MRTILLLLLLITFVMGGPPNVAVFSPSSSESDWIYWDQRCENYLDANVGNNNGILEEGGHLFTKSCPSYSQRFIQNYTKI